METLPRVDKGVYFFTTKITVPIRSFLDPSALCIFPILCDESGARSGILLHIVFCKIEPSCSFHPILRHPGLSVKNVGTGKPCIGATTRFPANNVSWTRGGDGIEQTTFIGGEGESNLLLRAERSFLPGEKQSPVLRCDVSLRLLQLICDFLNLGFRRRHWRPRNLDKCAR